MAFWWSQFFYNMLIPVVMIIAGVMMEKYCTDKPNAVLGYRTRRSMQNAETWKFANEFCGKLWWQAGWVMSGPTIVVQVAFRRSGESVIEHLSWVLIFLQILVILLTVGWTERALKKKFKN